MRTGEMIIVGTHVCRKLSEGEVIDLHKRLQRCGVDSNKEFIALSYVICEKCSVFLYTNTFNRITVSVASRNVKYSVLSEDFSCDYFNMISALE